MWVVQVNGKVRERIQMNSSLSVAQVEERALAADRVRQLLEGKSVERIVTVPGRLINIVVR